MRALAAFINCAAIGLGAIAISAVAVAGTVVFVHFMVRVAQIAWRMS
jgi:hypothetical protein